MRVKQYYWIKIFILFSIYFSACKLSEKEIIPPNFIIIFADDLGYGDLSSFGHPTIKTPNLDQMAHEGMKLTQFYVAASICTPSRAGLLTGKLPAKIGMSGARRVLFPDSYGGLPTTESTISSLLSKVGYNTACIGKWHLGHKKEFLPTQHGFDYYFGIPYSNDMSPPNNNWDYAKAAFPPLPLMEGTEIIELEPDQSQLTRRYTDKAIEFINKNKNKSFFLYFAHSFPHVPLHVDSTDAGKSKRGLYGDVVQVLDKSVGAILEKLKKLNIQENTFVIFTSDNGPWGWAGINGGSAGLLRGKKGSTWEGGFRVPTIAWMPGRVPKNKIFNGVGSTLDLLPTFMSMAGINHEEETFDGRDISSSFFLEKELSHPIFYYKQQELIAMRNGAWKVFIKNPNPRYKGLTKEDFPILFNLDEDPSEQYNLAKKNPDIIERMVEEVNLHVENNLLKPSLIDSIAPAYQAVFDQYN